ncbi:probable E3 ubiquitin-protein ligase TRIML1 isoform X1 [Onychostoma macrolepis]|uniref:B30.2/SPRY domain-containing protein n=2 Tax=Onychostoma macrolepis TaxID=369639 RepID=A0A7J6CEF0_9TELE|nr:probable E3 ubiquitin-protein ligase TRIML1 isoform X1 [Onychostoma macrolepis]XP_058652089.1 probable E3 ubiquitin-protein ligase TRIML1 isoform X1 [Onychostoma macrolepis]XP_058652090.1 probable E3 ubiquitin-protein ligase TRIML1 isoform X1 [Onychostoma macrolepis]XP_058652091.1 probable E3 ubiquitin-protein ligase TRIML1 isoform X1 [Onychostoma macrolepis]XP_058652092.1 probable E3 ubiquitin-protein ligase TRIML1 isoform X1 [Onychostoma macrolepis]XP_058652094.1 probable E3 ubiquitin-pro
MQKNNQDHLMRQREAIRCRLKKLNGKQNEIKSKSSAMRGSIVKKYEDMRRVLEEDCRITLSLLEMEETAAVRALDDLIEANCVLLRDIEVQLNEGMMDSDIQLGDRVTMYEDRVLELLTATEPGLIKLDEAKSDQLLGLTNNLLLFIRSQIPIAKRLLKSYSSEVVLDPSTAHPKLIISSEGDCATFTDVWQDVPEHEARFDTTLNVLSIQCWDSGHHYWEVDVSGKIYWELGLTYPSISRKGQKEDCWLGRHAESWCLEYFDGDYNAWHGGTAHPLPISTCFHRIGIFCSFPGGLVTFLGVDSMTPLYSFCAGTFTDSLHLALCPGHDLQGTNSKPVKICRS